MVSSSMRRAVLGNQMQWAFLEVNTRQESLSRVLVRVVKAKSRENKVTVEYATTWCDTRNGRQ